MNTRELKHVHLTGVGGINMSAVAKLLASSGVTVTGSDVHENEQTHVLEERGVKVMIGEAAEYVGPDVECLIYTSAAPESNLERVAAHERGIPEMTNFEFLADWFREARVLMVTGTHGKSTTTAMLGEILVKAGVNPTVIVGSKVPGFADGNLRVGSSSMLVIEGDEFARHFLEFATDGVVLNNIEHDHPDIYPTLEDVYAAFQQALGKVKSGGVVIANLGDAGVRKVIAREHDGLVKRGVKLVTFTTGDDGEGKVRVHATSVVGGERVELMNDTEKVTWTLQVPGEFNACNAAGAFLMAREFGATSEVAVVSLEAFSGIWRRFERVAEWKGAPVFSDYAHHPTAIAKTLQAARESWTGSKIVLCYQPHQRHRTRELFFDFISSFDAADVLVLCEIYDVAGRDSAGDTVSSRDLVDALLRHDADRGVSRPLVYAATPAEAIEETMKQVTPDACVLIMGAGDIDSALRRTITQTVV